MWWLLGIALMWLFARRPDIRKALEEHPEVAEAVEFASAVTGEDPFVLAAIAERESAFGRALDASGRGDGGHGHGVWQIDDRYHGEFVASGGWRDPVRSAIYAAELLRGNRAQLRVLVGDEVGVEMLERAAIAAYNASLRSVVRGIREVGDPDRYTTGGNYSADVMRRAERLRRRAGW